MEQHISFFIPAYNCERFIEEAVHSIMKTNFLEGDELVICDDCSTDSTPQILDKLCSEYPQIKVVHHSHNHGGPVARNTAILNTTKDILFCLDSDNVLCDNSIQALKEFMISKNAESASFGEVRYFHKDQPKENFSHSWFWKYPVFDRSNVLSTIYFPGSSGNYMFTRHCWEMIGGYLPNMRILDTWTFGFRQCMEGFPIAIMEGTYYYHRYGMNSNYMRNGSRYNHSLMALSAAAPYMKQFRRKDIWYMFGLGRYKWVDNLEKHPIYLKEEEI